ncbi:isochorismatase family protein [Pseudooceanicola nanhaiensis]|uniref:isochorismatase family protein n=1 Tax=Pseudooceanicola nanhaiensis TaxID=375761 RepID=UPI001CD6C53E|nr:isochorismatase family protein [Pseudooceanicola nanhaiensis]MCA0921640.1 isochorismatase family protein [Pseudooceanicola nanhaiensis]
MSEDLGDNYARAYGKKAGYGQRPALVLVDFAQAYYDPDCPLYGAEGCVNALASALRIREAAHKAGLPVILTEVYYPDDRGLTAGRFWQKAKPLAAFVKGRSTAAFADGLVPREDEVIVSKQYPSAFFGTSLAPMLTAMGVDNVILTGLTTSGCVRASCVDSMSHGFITTVVGDACGDRHPGPHEANLFDMNAKYADVVSEAEILDHLATLA